MIVNTQKENSYQLDKEYRKHTERQFISLDKEYCKQTDSLFILINKFLPVIIQPVTHNRFL